MLAGRAFLVLLIIIAGAALGADHSQQVKGDRRAAAPESVATKYPDAARCFFVYAALNEAGKKHGRPDLERYALLRLMWFRGFNDALIADPVWKAEFETPLKANKRQAESLAAKLSAAAAANSVREYDAAVREGDACDRRLGLYQRER
jgi:hypothetical protein